MSLDHREEEDHQDGSESTHSELELQQRPTEALSTMHTHASHSHDPPMQVWTSNIEIPDEVYDRIAPSKKLVIVALLSFCSFLAPVSSTTVLAATPEVAATYDTTGTIINLSNALYMVFMGVSPMFLGPISQVYGRRIVGL